MKIYLDTNVYCRPFDDQTQKKIMDEARAFLKIIENVIDEKLFLVSSEILQFEINQMEDFEKRIKVSSFLTLTSTTVYGTLEQLTLSQRLERDCGLKGRDALHLAAAFAGRASYLITCDNEFLNKVKCCSALTKQEGFEVKLINPIDYLKRLKPIRRGKNI